MGSTSGGGRWSAINTGFPYRIDDSGRYFYPYVWTLAIDPQTPATLYAGTGTLPLPWQAGAVFKSTNGGGSWSAVITGLYDVFVLAIDPLTPTTLYIGDGGNAYKSINGGGSWSA